MKIKGRSTRRDKNKKPKNLLVSRCYKSFLKKYIYNIKGIMIQLLAYYDTITIQFLSKS